MKIRFVKDVNDVLTTTSKLVNGQLEVVSVKASYPANTYLHGVGNVSENGNGTLDISLSDGTMVSAVPSDAIERHDDAPTNVDVQPRTCCRER